MPFRSAMRARVCSCSSTILWRSSWVRRCSRMSRMARAWISESSSRRIRASRAASGFSACADEPDDEVELLDGLAQALRGCGRAPRRARDRTCVRRVTTSRRKLMNSCEHLLEIDDLRPPAHQGQHDDAERGLHLRVLVELVDDDLRDLAPPELEHDPDALAVRLVAALGDALDLLVADQLADLLDEGGLVHLVRQLGDDDGLAAAPHLLRRAPWRAA